MGQEVRTPADALRIRTAQEMDADAIAAILVEAFPSLYKTTFGLSNPETVRRLLAALYRAGHLLLRTVRVCEYADGIVGLCILNLGEGIGHGSVGSYWRLLHRELGLWSAVRAFCGGVSTHSYLNARIPRAADLVYIEALAVASAERRRGVGTCLLFDAEEWTRRRGRTRLALHVLQRNTEARRLYERLGFHLWPENQPLRSSRWHALLMARSLP